MKRNIREGNDYRMVCIKVGDPNGNTYHRMIRGIARKLIAQDPRITYTSKSRWRKFARKGE